MRPSLARFFFSSSRADGDEVAGDVGTWAASTVARVKRRGDVAGLYGPQGFMLVMAQTPQQGGERCCRRLGQMPSALLLDGHAPGKHGGTGVPAPWKLLAEFRPGIPVILAGGLTPDNVAEAVRIVRPYGVDVASGVEVSPGIKDAELVVAECAMPLVEALIRRSMARG